MQIGITGTKGLLDWHMRCFLRTFPDIQVKSASRSTFQSVIEMESFVQGCDAIVHLAGMNRGDDKVLYDTNIGLTQALINACESVKVNPHVIFSSSTHFDQETAYGKSKRECASILGDWASRRNAAFTELILPHVFGEGGLPFYNSAVSTFCHQIAHAEIPIVNRNGQLEPIHAQTVTEQILEIIQERKLGRIRLTGHQISVGELYDLISSLAIEYAGRIIPDISDPFRLSLFNTYRSYLFPAAYPVELIPYKDERGELVETVKSRHGGQTFVSTTRPGITRGNHFHLRKIERFLVLSGEAAICLRRLESDEVVTFYVKGDRPCCIDIPTMHTHNITNIGERPLMALFWSNEIFDASKPDTYPEPVILDE